LPVEVKKDVLQAERAYQIVGDVKGRWCDFS
jgi:hypothetical protein